MLITATMKLRGFFKNLVGNIRYRPYDTIILGGPIKRYSTTAAYKVNQLFKGQQKLLMSTLLFRTSCL